MCTMYSVKRNEIEYISSTQTVYRSIFTQTVNERKQALKSSYYL